VVDTQASGRSSNVWRSSLATSGCPVSITRRSSTSVAVACGSLKMSKSVLPITSSSDRPCPVLASQPSLTSRNRLSRSLKKTLSSGFASRLRVHRRAISARDEKLEDRSDGKSSKETPRKRDRGRAFPSRGARVVTHSSYLRYRRASGLSQYRSCGIFLVG
jgi:hypothetical protein